MIIENNLREKKYNFDYSTVPGKAMFKYQEALGFEYPQAIYKWKRGECLPTLDNLLILSVMLETTIDKIIISNYL